MVDIEVVPAPGFGGILVSATKIPLAAPDAGVIPRGRDRKHSPHGQDPAANVLVVKVTAEADLLQLNFVGPEDLGRSAQRVILGMVQTAYEVSIESYFRSEKLRIPHRVFVASLAVEPSPIGIRKRLGRGRLLGCGCRT